VSTSSLPSKNMISSNVMHYLKRIEEKIAILEVRKVAAPQCKHQIKENSIFKIMVQDLKNMENKTNQCLHNVNELNSVLYSEVFNLTKMVTDLKQSLQVLVEFR